MSATSARFPVAPLSLSLSDRDINSRVPSITTVHMQQVIKRYGQQLISRKIQVTSYKLYVASGQVLESIRGEW